jgi:hypothetical protein
MLRKQIRIFMPPVALALALAASAFGKAAHGFQTNTLQKKRVVVRGLLTATKENLQVTTWQTPNKSGPSAPYAQAHMAIETTGPDARVLWQTDGSSAYYQVSSIQTADLDGDGVVEIMSLWWAGASAGALLRVFHWDNNKKSFIELSAEGDLNGIHRYRVAGGGRNRSQPRLRLVTYVRPHVGAGWPPVPGGEYEVRGSEIVRAGRGDSGGRMDGTSRIESGIEGQAVITPTSPVLRANMPRLDPAPFETTLVVVTAGERREVARLKTGSDGRFRVSLPPGQYIVKPQTEGRRWPRGGEQEVTVTSGKFSQVTITFDSGIR